MTNGSGFSSRRKSFSWNFRDLLFATLSDPQQAYIEGPYSGPDLRFSYRLALYLYPDYPYEMPRLYVHQPSPLYTYDGRRVPTCSHEFHIWSYNDRGGIGGLPLQRRRLDPGSALRGCV